jgi:hypothetical protein
MVAWTVPFALVLLPVGLVAGVAFITNHGVRGFRPEGTAGGVWFAALGEDGKLHRQVLVPRRHARDDGLVGTLEEAEALRKKNGGGFFPVLLVS